jgi:hypothetical protein
VVAYYGSKSWTAIRTLVFVILIQIGSKELAMKDRPGITVRRRDLLSVAIVGAAAAATNTMVSEPAAAEPRNIASKRKARYQANSAEVRDFYRVNSYPRQ